MLILGQPRDRLCKTNSVFSTSNERCASDQLFHRDSDIRADEPPDHPRWDQPLKLLAARIHIRSQVNASSCFVQFVRVYSIHDHSIEQHLVVYVRIASITTR